MTPRYNELTPYQQQQADQIINEIASWRYHEGVIANIVESAMQAGRTNVTLSLTVPEVRWLIGHTAYEDGIGRDIHQQAKRAVPGYQQQDMMGSAR